MENLVNCLEEIKQQHLGQNSDKLKHLIKDYE